MNDEKVKARDAQEYEKILAEKELQIEKLRSDNEIMSNLIHRDNKLLPALYAAVIYFMESDKKAAEDGAHLLNQIELITEERAGILKRSLYYNEMLPSTENIMLDGIFHYMKKRASEEEVEFDIAELNDFSGLVETIIPATQLHTLLADLIENAINATSHCKIKKVMISFCSNKGVFELCVQDSGVFFDAETLVNLGMKKATTREHEGGCGIGYMTIFEILRKCKASLIINEYEQGKSIFSKSISIRFDERAEYMLKTYRAEEMKAIISEIATREDIVISGNYD